MNQQFIKDFVKRATDAGLTQAQAEQFLTENFFGGKTAAQQLDEHITGLLSEASVVKSAQTVAYVEGLMKAAVEHGASVEQATGLAKVALQQGEFPRVQQKQASQNTVNEKAVAYAESFLKSAHEAGYEKDQAIELLKKANPQILQQLQSALGNPTVQGGLGGAALGGAAGYGLTDNEQDKGSNALVAALLGGGLGAGAGEFTQSNLFKQMLGGGAQ